MDIALYMPGRHFKPRGDLTSGGLNQDIHLKTGHIRIDLPDSFASILKVGVIIFLLQTNNRNVCQVTTPSPLSC
jgi:hypothetical protein